MKNILYHLFFFALIMGACTEGEAYIANGAEPDYSIGDDVLDRQIQVGASQIAMYYPKIKDKKLGLVVNQTSRVGSQHLVDTLQELEASISAIFAPEHGFRGKEDAGTHIESGLDPETGIPIISIYGKNKKPSPEQLKDIDVMIFDIQDVGARFYTYISTLHYIMEACAEVGLPLIVLDRPNPNGFYVDGPILDPAFRSFVGMHEVPIVHGMTIGEYAKMINEEGWLADGVKCDLEVIPCVNYLHNMTYELPVKPSPNLPNLRAIMLYPSICFFEGTNVSIGRGTDNQFQVIGHPSLQNYDYSFTPSPKPGATNPKLKDKKCNGIDLTKYSTDYLKGNAKLDLSWLIEIYKAFPDKENFFLNSNFFDKLAGGTHLREQLINGLSEEEIRETWQPGLENYKAIRNKYLLYARG